MNMKKQSIWKTTVIAAAALLIAAGNTGALYSPSVVFPSAISASAAETETARYSVNITLMQFQSDAVSMGNASMDPEAHIVVAPDGTANLEIDMHSLTYLGQDGYLGWMKKVTAIISENKFHYPTEIETEDVTVVEEYVDVYDIFNDPDSDYLDANVEGKWYPKKLSLPIDFENREDEILVQVYVPVMESIMEGGGTKFAVLDIDWDTLQKEESEQPPESTEPTTTTTSDEQTSTTTTTTTAEETTTTTTAPQTTEAPTTTPPASSAYDKDHLADGKYELFAEMLKADRTGYSMSNNGINHTVQLEVVNGEYFLTVQFKGLAIYNQFGYLMDLYYYNSGYTYNMYGQPEGSVTQAEVISYYDVVDQYNDAAHLYPQVLRFPLVDKASGEFVPLRVFVPIMEAISDGTGTQNVLMQLDWSALVRTDNDFQVEEPEEQSPEFNYTDSATGVKLHADKGVLPEGAKGIISKVTSGNDYNTAKDALATFSLYSISVADSSGNAVGLNGKMQISLPIPSGVSEPIVYRITDGKKTKISGTAENGYFTFSVKEVGNYAIGGDANGTTTTTTANNASKTAVPKTGDTGVAAATAGIALAGMTAIVSRRRKKQ